MSNFSFVIPLNRDDLFESSSVNQYVVENVYNVRDLKVKIQDANHDVQQSGPTLSSEKVSTSSSLSSMSFTKTSTST